MKYSNNIRALASIANSINISEKKDSFVDKCQLLVTTIESICELYIKYAKENNKLSDWAKRLIQGDKNLSKNNQFSETVSSLFKSSEKHNLTQSTNFKEIIYYTPLIMNDSTLESNRYNPNNITDKLRELASKTHKRLIDSYNNPNRNVNIVITNLCKLLYEIRSNMMHCGKTPSGPDLDKSIRDEEICKLIYPTLLNIINVLLEQPDSKLLLYGTLKSGGINSSIVDNLRTFTKDTLVYGFVEIENGFSYYTFSISNMDNKVETELITNDFLTNKFDKLDAFEGKKYRRIRVPYLDGENIGIGHIYERNNIHNP